MNIERYRVKEGEKVDLSQYATACDVDIDKKKVKKRVDAPRDGRTERMAGKAVCR